MKTTPFLKPDWPAPANISSYCSTRHGGLSLSPYESMNIASHVGDNLEHIKSNRAELKSLMQLPREPNWLEQVHGSKVVEIGRNDNRELIQADGVYTKAKQVVLTVMVADCLPVLIASADGQEIAAVHAGWKGLAANILAEACSRFVGSTHLLAWLGPAIGPCHYEVGDDVRSGFSGKEADCFKAGKDRQHWWLDMVALAKIQLEAAGVSQVYGGGFCTHHEKERFFSYRRDGVTGRFGVFIWMD